MMEEKGITYRLATDTDLEQIVRLWVEETEWGAFPFAEVERWQKAPGGPPQTVLAIETATGQVIGQFGFVPTVVYAAGSLIRGVRPHSTIVSARLREMSSRWDLTQQPSSRMYRFGLELLGRQGAQVAHMIPNPRWVRLMRIFGKMREAQFPLWSIPFPLSRSFVMPEGFSYAPLKEWSDEIDQLAQAAANQYACGIVRTAEVLEWKSAIEGSTVIEVRRDSKLMGVVCARTKGDRQWLITDMISLDSADCLRATLAAIVIEGDILTSQHLDDERHPIKAAILATPLMLPALKSLGFRKDSYTFSLLVERIDESLDFDLVDPGGWYLAASD